MTLAESILEAWDKQCACLLNLTTLLDADLLRVKASADGWDVAFHLCHVHDVRREWLKGIAGTLPEGIHKLLSIPEGAVNPTYDSQVPSYDLVQIAQQLKLSQKAIRDFLGQTFQTEPAPIGPYRTAADFHQHMVWHEGYHFALIVLAMRLAAREPNEDWEEENIWGNFRQE
jgi:uncharacterized damage-inducible protein DinB